ncbi:RHS repeat-associated core domain-containing protein, partial [Photobacterium alginatilyticum]|uniref:RHS repeat-associated core domain-containing protein n=1 Tax=Photobacterium alginatilyticum TaxID=1775171 RepID=UPI004068D9BB
WQAEYSIDGLASPVIETISNPLRFQGQYFDEESGLHYNRFRYYDPKAGRFIHQDPIGLLGGLNPYQYAPNPVQWVDPLGLSCKEGAAVVAVARAVPYKPTLNVLSNNVIKLTTQAAANDALYTVERSLLAELAPALSRIAAAIPALLYSPSAGGVLEQYQASDGTTYSKYSSELLFKAVAPSGETWFAENIQDDINYRTWLANGGDGTFEDWLSQGKPDSLEQVEVESSVNFDFDSTASVTFEDFCETVDEFEERGALAQDAFKLFKEQNWDALHVLFNENKLNGGWPPNRGAISTSDVTLPVGTRIDRYGGFIDSGTGEFRDLGTFVAKAEEPFEKRALPLDTINKPYKKYEVVIDIPDIPDVQAGKVIPWFNQAGKGMQYELPLSIEELIDNGFLKEIN